MAGADIIELTEEEQQALHELKLASRTSIEVTGLLDFHHAIGRGRTICTTRREILKEAGHEKRTNILRDEALRTGVLEDKWTYEIVESFEREVLIEVSGSSRTFGRNSRTEQSTSRNADDSRPHGASQLIADARRARHRDRGR
jgi:hypothetical protein